MSPEMLYVYTIWQEGSFSKAAKKLYLTQPALSIAVRKLEERIGMPLFDRKRKPLCLTDAGEIYIETAQKELQLEREQQQKFDDIKNLSTGSVCIGGTHYLNAYILPEVLADFSRRYPGIELQIKEGSARSVAQMLADRSIDVTFNCDPELVRDFPRYEMFVDHVLLAVPASDPINEQYGSFALTAEQVVRGEHLDPWLKRIGLDAFAELPIILLRRGNNLHDRAWGMFKEVQVEPVIKMELNQLVTAFHLAEAGMGATFVSDRIVDVHSDSLLFYPLASALAKRTFYILLPKDAYVPVSVRKLVDHILEWNL